jgi:hypothetical protein
MWKLRLTTKKVRYEMLEYCSKLLANCSQTDGKLLANCWQSVDKLFQTIGKLLTNYYKLIENVVEKVNLT